MFFYLSEKSKARSKASYRPAFITIIISTEGWWIEIEVYEKLNYNLRKTNFLFFKHHEKSMKIQRAGTMEKPEVSPALLL